MEGSAVRGGPDAAPLAPVPPPSGWRVIAASARGSVHERTEQPCQDAHFWRVLPGGILVAAVADGAGSAALAEVGAAAAARTGVEAICRQHGEPVALIESEGWRARCLDALKAARMAVEEAAAARGVPARDLATTLILVVATPELAAAAQVGDGAVVLEDETGSLLALTAPQHGEYLNETVFLTSDGFLDAAQWSVHPGSVRRVALFTDGLQQLALKMPEGAPHAPFFAPLFRFAGETTDEAAAREQLAGFLGSPRVRERTDDDVTLLLAAWESS